MSTETVVAIIKGASTMVAMALIGMLVRTALLNGIDGVMFFCGVAAIAGLGGYEIRWLVDVIKTRTGGVK